MDDVIVTEALPRLRDLPLGSKPRIHVPPVPNLLRLWRLVLPDYAEVDICRLLSRHGTSAYGMPYYVTKTAGV